MVLLNGFLVFAMTGLASTVVANEYRPACEAVKAAISSASDVYYPGECEPVVIGTMR